MGSGDKAASCGPQRAGTTSRPHLQKILLACKHHADQYMEALFKQVLDKLEEALISRSDKEEGGPEDDDANAYADAESELRANRAQIYTAFCEGFTQNYNSQLNRRGGASSKKGGQASGLSLVDEQELEESLAVDGLVARARDRMRNELYALAQRFNALIEDAHYDEESHPLDPEVFSHAFRDAIQKTEFNVEVKLIAYKLFDQSVMQSLAEFYYQVNSLLSDSGVLPELKLSIPLRAVGNASHGRSGQSKDTQGTSREHDDRGGAGPEGMQEGSPGEMSSSADVYQTLQTLMNARKYGDAPAGARNGDGADGLSDTVESSAEAGSSLQEDDLVRGLSMLQHDTLPTMPGGAISVAAIKDALLGQMKHSGDARGINPTHDNTIDVIGMIFEFILDEPSIPEVVKTLLNQLQIPILKIAIVDKEFFTDKNHAARRLLNVLGHASIGWNDNDEEVRQRRFQKMEYVVNRALAEFEQDPGIFGALLEEFADFLAKEGEDVEIEEASPSSEEPPEDHLDRLAFEAIEARLEGADVPGVLRDFLRDSWRDVLQHVLDQEGHDGEAWHRHEQTIDDLMWSVEPKTTADDRRKMVTLLPRLLDALRAGMSLIGSSQEQTDAVIDALEPIHMACLRGERDDPAAVAPPAGDAELRHDVPAEQVAEANVSVQESSPPEDQATAGEEKTSVGGGMSDFERELLGVDASFVQEVPGDTDIEPAQIEDEFTAMAADMGLGTWLEFDLEDKKRRAKLAWKSVVMGEYVFVDRKYKVVAERTLSSLAADLREGRASLVEDVAMFDRALDKVLNGLMSGSRTTH